MDLAVVLLLHTSSNYSMLLISDELVDEAYVIVHLSVHSSGIVSLHDYWDRTNLSFPYLIS